MRFKLLGTEIYVSFLFAAILTLMLAVDKTGFVIPTVFAVFMHEAGHLFAMWLLECNPKQIRLIPSSVQIIRDFNTKQSGEIIIALCGPAVNIVLFGALYFNYHCFGNEIVLWYAALNLVIGIFNLLPVNGLDGGTVLINMLLYKLELNRSTLILKIVTAIFAMGAFCAAIYLTVTGKINISLYIIAVYLLVMALIKI